MIARAGFGCLLLLLMCGPLVPGPQVYAEPNETFDPDEMLRGFGVRDTRSAKFALQEARAALAKGDVLVGVRAAQRVLDRMQDDFFMQLEKSSRASVLWSSAAEVAREILAGLTAEQREVYNEFVRPTALPLIESATAGGDPKSLEVVLRRYGASPEGLRAARLLTELAMEAGRWRDAARYAREGLRFAPKDPALWRRAVASLALAGDAQVLETLRLAEGVQVQSDEDDERTVALKDYRAAWLKRIPPRPESQGWPMWGGAPDRARVQAAPPPTPQLLRWEEKLAVAERRLDRARAYFNNTTDGVYRDLVGRIDPVHPVSTGRTVYVADGRSVRAYDAFTGRTIWRFHHRTAKEVLLYPDEPEDKLPGRTSLERAFSPVVAGGRVVATIEWWQDENQQELQSVVIDAFLPSRGIVTLDQKDGTRIWDRVGRHDPEFPRGVVVSPPVVAEGLVVALISEYDHNHNVSCVAFDLETGELRWRRALGFGQQELNLFGYPTKELAGSAIAASEGIAYMSTGLGFVAAVDIRSGIPRWLASYEALDIRPVKFWYEAPIRRPRVAPSPPMVFKDSVLFAPTDSRFIYVFDRLTGVMRWRERHRRDAMPMRSMAHVLGVTHDGKRDVVVLTDTMVRARDLRTGKEVWNGHFTPEGAEVRGRGTIAGDTILVPTDEGLHRFAVSSEGKFLGRDPWPPGAQPGNVLATGQALIVAARDRLLSFFDWKDIEANANRRMKEYPNDPTALLEAGELYWKGGQVERARKAFTRVLPLAEKAGDEALRRARTGLMNTWLTASDLAADISKALAAARKALTYADARDQKVHVHLAIHNLRDLDLATRIDNLQELVKIAGDAEDLFESDGLEPVRASARLKIASLYRAGDRPAKAIDALQDALREDRDTVVRGRPVSEIAERSIASILRVAGRTAYARHDEAARKLLAEARGEDAQEVLTTLLAQYPNALVVPDALQQRARRRLADGNAPGAALDLRELLDRQGRSDPAARAATLALLHRAWTRSGARGAARYVAVLLHNAYADTRFEFQGETVTGKHFVARLDPLPQPEPPAGLSGMLREVHVEPAGDEEQMRPTLQRDDIGAGEAPVRMAVRAGNLLALHMIEHKLAWQVPCITCRLSGWSPFGIVTASGQYGRDLEGRDPADGTVVWSVPLQRYVIDLALAYGQAFVLTRDTDVRKRDFHLEAFDIPTGRRLWSRSLGKVEHRQLGVWRDRVFVEHRRLLGGRSVTQLRLFNGVDGRAVAEIDLPLGHRATRAAFDGKLVAAYYDAKKHVHRVAAWSLETGADTWDITLDGKESAVSLVPAPGNAVVLLRDNGDVITMAADDGSTKKRTRIYVGERRRARPYPGTTAAADEKHFMLIPQVGRDARLATYDRRTGKLLWDVILAERNRPNRVEFAREGDVVWILVCTSSGRQQTNKVLLVDMKTGKRLQSLEPTGLSGGSLAPDIRAGHGGLVLIGRQGAAILGPGK